MPHKNAKNIPEYTLEKLREDWEKCWNLKPHKSISRQMLEASLEFKQNRQKGIGINAIEQMNLDRMVFEYRQSGKLASINKTDELNVKIGTRMIRVFNGQRHCVTVVENGFEHEGNIYKSLSAIASKIAGTRWNGWVFFGIKSGKKK